MKGKILLFIVLFWGISNLLKAQDRLIIDDFDTMKVKKFEEKFQPELCVGVNGGMTFSKVGFQPTIKQDLLMQGTGGITVRYISEKSFGLQVEINYSLKGWKESMDSVKTTLPNSANNTVDTVTYYTKYTRSLAYIEIPVMTHAYFSLGKSVRGFILAGPQLGYEINEKVVEAQLYSDGSVDHSSYHYKKIQNKFDWGIVGGFGLELRTGIGNFTLDGRYYFGLSDIFGNTKADTFQASPYQVLSAKLTYLVPTHFSFLHNKKTSK